MERTSVLPSWRWAKTLLTRADSSLWRQDVEFVASLYNIHLRREQIGAVEASVQQTHFSDAEKETIASLTVTNLVAHALASGDVDSVRQLLRREGLEKPLETAFRRMQIIQRSVRGSEAEKDNLLPRFFALRLWSGCSSLFFTLNPHDIKSPLTISLLQNDMEVEKQFSLDWQDAQTEAYIVDFLKDNPRRLHEAVASNPLAATRCFHWTVKLVIRTLFHCDVAPGSAVDSVPARETPEFSATSAHTWASWSHRCEKRYTSIRWCSFGGSVTPVIFSATIYCLMFFEGSGISLQVFLFEVLKALRITWGSLLPSKLFSKSRSYT